MNAPEPFESLMQQALAGDNVAYEALLRRSAGLLRPYLNKRLNSPSDAEDVLQEILLSLHKARVTYDGQRPFLPWMFAIARFRLQDHLRAHYKDRLRHAGDLEEAENNLAFAVTESDFSYESIREEVHRLPEKQAMILELMHSQGYTAKEVGQKMQMNESAVKVAAHRAYKKLKKTLVG